MPNPFHEIAETSSHNAVVLAHAFCASNGDFEGLFACLRMLDRIHGRAGGHFGGYLDGCHFDPEVFERQYHAGLEAYRESAYAFLESVDSKAHEYPRV